MLDSFYYKTGRDEKNLVESLALLSTSNLLLSPLEQKYFSHNRHFFPTLTLFSRLQQIFQKWVLWVSLFLEEFVK